MLKARLSRKDFSAELIAVQSICGTWDKEYLLITLADLTVVCIHESEQFSGHIAIAIMPFLNLCTRDGFGYLDKKIPHLSQGLWNC